MRHTISSKASRAQTDGRDGMSGAYLGPSFPQAEIERRLTAAGATFAVLGEDEMIETTAQALAAAKSRGLVSGSDGVRPALARRALDPR